MALSSHSLSDSVVELSESPLFHYQFSSVFKGIDSFAMCTDRFEIPETSKFCFSQIAPRKRYLFQLDVTPSLFNYSESLPDRQYVKVPNTVISGNKPVEIGYPLSCLHLQVLDGQKWSLPMVLHRLGSQDDSKEIGVKQLESLLQAEDLPFKEAELIINTADTAYQHPSFIAPLYKYDNLVNVIRLKKGGKVYKQQFQTQTGGRNKHKGKKAYLLMESQIRYAGAFSYQANSIFETYLFDEYLEIERTTTKGRVLTVHLYRFNNFLLESKKGASMLDKPIDIVVSLVCDAQTGQPVFQPMYLAVSNQKRKEVSLEEVFDAYRHRYDIEPAFRFGKQRLKLDSYQTCQIDHFDKWLLIYQLAYWLVFVASDEVNYQPAKWRSYQPANKVENLKTNLSPTQTFSALENLLLKIDPEAFKPRASNKGNGREKGTKLPKKKKQKVIKKRTKPSKIDKKEQLNV